jgi:RNA 2',3'-cyclic 3'-phosphodiesterase
MDKHLRAFLAIALPKDIRWELERRSRDLKRQSFARASWVRPENFHVTLRFFGEVTEEEVDGLGDFLSDEYRGVGSGSIRLRGTGFFPNDQRPRVLWVGVDDPKNIFPELHRIAELGEQHIGIAPERTAFHPHITLARIKAPKTASELVEATHSDSVFFTRAFPLQSVTLFKSTLTRRGAIYSALREFPLT